MNFELPDWKDPSVDSTAQLGHQCDLDFEARLIGHSRGNYVYLALKNNSKEDLVMKPEEVNMTFGNGRARMASYMNTPGNVELKSGWRIVGAIPFRINGILKIKIVLLSRFRSTMRKVCLNVRSPPPFTVILK